MESGFNLIIFSRSDSLKPKFAYFFHTIAENLQHFSKAKRLFKEY